MVLAIFSAVAQASSVVEMFAQSRMARAAQIASAINLGAAKEAPAVAMHAQPLAANAVQVLLMGTSTQ